MAPRDSRLLSEQRRRKILDLIDQKGQITVRELAERFSVSAVTARGDLDALCSEELAVRSHGGAVRKLEGGHEYGPTPKKVSRYQDPRRSKVVTPGTGNRTITIVWATATRSMNSSQKFCWEPKATALDKTGPYTSFPFAPI